VGDLGCHYESSSRCGILGGYSIGIVDKASVESLQREDAISASNRLLDFT
jgi:hypothetical protein